MAISLIKQWYTVLTDHDVCITYIIHPSLVINYFRKAYLQLYMETFACILTDTITCQFPHSSALGSLALSVILVSKIVSACQ